MGVLQCKDGINKTKSTTSNLKEFLLNSRGNLLWDKMKAMKTSIMKHILFKMCVGLRQQKYGFGYAL